jgi:Ca-activated chloride channel homolog
MEVDMRLTRQLLTHALVLSLALSLTYTTAEARDNEFKALVKHIETHYRARRTRIPFLGLAGFIVKIVRPAGVKGFKLAVFEDQDFSLSAEDRSFESVMGRALSAEWQPLVRVHSRKSGERVYIYAKPKGKDLELMIATLEQREAVVIQVKVNPDTLAKWMERPDRMGGIFNARHDRGGPTEASIFSGGGAVSHPETAAASPDAAEGLTAFGADTSPPPATAAGAQPQAISEKTTRAAESSSPLSVPAAASAALSADAVRINTQLINLNAKVLDAAGRPVLDLKREDFEIYEDGAKQEVSHFAPVTAPINMVLLLDLSGSTEKKQKVIKQAAQKFVDSLGPQDRVAVGTFGRRLHLESDFTADRRALKRIIGDIKSRSSGTAYYDSMWKTLGLFGNVNGGRKAVVVLTDGVDNSIAKPIDYPTDHGFDELLRRVGEEDVTIYPMYLDTEYEMVVKQRREKARTYEIARGQLKAVAEQSGGLLFRVDRIEDLEGVYRRVADELRTLYSLAYSSNNDGEQGRWRTVKVGTSRAGLVARAKRGYYAK